MPTIGSSGPGLNPQFQRLIQRTLKIESQPRERLESERQQKKDLKSTINDLDGKLSSLQGQLSSLSDTTSNPLTGIRATTSESTEAFSVSASDSASKGTYSLSVSRLASEDGRVTQTYDSDGSGLRTFFDNNGAQTFSVEVATPTDSNPDKRTSIDVTVDPDGTTNKEILKNVRSAIDSAFQQAVDDGTISSEERPSSSVIDPDSSTSRLSLRSATTGYRGRLSFTDSADGLLSELQLNANQLADSTQGGELTEVGSSEDTSKLTSEFTLDGLTLVRNSNTVTDALDGVTINLEKANGTTSSFEVKNDVEGAKGAIQDFIDKFNQVNSFLQDKTEVNPESDSRGALADDSTFRRLQSRLRSDATRPVSSQPSGVDTLGDIGIEAQRDGTLEIADEEALESALRENQTAVRDLFSGSDGVASRLEQRVNQFVDAGGILESRVDTIESTIDRLDDRVEDFNARLDRRRERLRSRYTRLQETLRSLSSQQSFISARL